ncbi:MAG TPA: hypothetical protein VHB30_00590, partial [Solirubrobacteraceae bacterium]|nr:hypothetical protein [Solirubrobacteraceae bacterium]
ERDATAAVKGAEPLLSKQPDPLLEDGPPDDVLAEVDRAHKVVEQLAAQNVEMRFDVDQGSGQITVELRDGNGKTLRKITLVEALDVASGRLAPFDAGAEPGADRATGAGGEPRADVYDSKGRLT